jgi:hypothetical protein
VPVVARSAMGSVSILAFWTPEVVAVVSAKTPEAARSKSGVSCVYSCAFICACTNAATGS